MNPSKNTTAAGAGFGAAAGSIVVYVAEALSRADFPETIDAAIITVVAVLIAAVWPASSERGE